MTFTEIPHLTKLLGESGLIEVKNVTLTLPTFVIKAIDFWKPTAL